MYNRERLVMTDLNGTLLDEHGRADDAAQALQLLAEAGIPVVFNSSKSAEDIRHLQRALQIRAPFISEQGAALWLPDETGEDEYQCRHYGMTRKHIVHVLAEIAAELSSDYLAFSALTEQQILQFTGLDPVLASLFSRRQYTETLLWRDSSAAFDEFSARLQDYDLKAWFRTGIVQVRRAVDKGMPMNDLRQWYREQGWPPLQILALGDGSSDLPMLQQADLACLFGSSRTASADSSHAHISFTPERGPQIWNHMVLQWLEQIH